MHSIYNKASTVKTLSNSPRLYTGKSTKAVSVSSHLSDLKPKSSHPPENFPGFNVPKNHMGILSEEILTEKF